MPGRWGTVGSALVALIAMTIASCSGGDAPTPAGGASSSPAIVAVEGVEGLPATVAELPTTDATAFRTLMDELRGTPVVVNLWASWCEPCMREMPMLSRAAADHPDVQFLGIDTLDSRTGGESFIAEQGVSFPSLFDPDGAVRTELGSFGLPVTVFFDAGGTQIAKIDGELSQEALAQHLDEISG
jgi:thiol-disulfide isomerase/thioredoxin